MISEVPKDLRPPPAGFHSGVTWIARTSAALYPKPTPARGRASVLRFFGPFGFLRPFQLVLLSNSACGGLIQQLKNHSIYNTGQGAGAWLQVLGSGRV